MLIKKIHCKANIGAVQVERNTGNWSVCEN
jgi:hypothetical protein